MTAGGGAACAKSGPCIDQSQIDGLVDAAGRDGALDILAAFWRSTESLLASLKNELEAGALVDASRTAHAIKGSALNVGAVRLSGVIREIEDRCRGNDVPGALALIAAADAQYAETIAAFEAHLGR